MRLWRYMILVAALLGIGGFFAPFFEYRAPDGSLWGASAYEVAMQKFDVGTWMTGAETLGVVSHAEATRITAMVNKVMAGYRLAMIGAFIPVALLALTALGCFARREMGRITGIGVFALGTASIGIYVFVFDIADPSRTTSGQLGLGIYLLLVCGLISMLAGVLALLFPDRIARA
ncbi:MAG: hypothetical protein ACKV2T_18530 [Kofleriaceae bacterium]